VSGQRRIRLFLDSNVLRGGIVSPWGLDKAMLSLCVAKVCKLVLAEMVRDEVEEILLLHAELLPSIDADQLIDDYHRLIKLTNPELVPYPDKHRVRSSRNLIRHEAVPVLLSAIASKPDWLLTHNTNHFTPAVAQWTSLRIATPAEFFRELRFVPVNAGYVPLDKRDLPPANPSAVRILRMYHFLESQRML
jgi:predicted nucleic acid-binding protein